MASSKGAPGQRPVWLLDGMDPNTSFNLEIKIVSHSCRFGSFRLDKVVDADTKNFKDLVDDVTEKYPHGYGEIVKVFYFCLDSKVLQSCVLRGVGELCAKRGSGFRFVVDWVNRTCSCRVWQGSGIPCKHAIAYITSIPTAKLEDRVDDYFSVVKFKAAYAGRIPSILDKSMWPKATHGFFMHPPLLKSTAGGRRKNRMKGAVEWVARRNKEASMSNVWSVGPPLVHLQEWESRRHSCNEGREGPPKKKMKKANIETSLVVATASSGMKFPYNEQVQQATHTKRKRSGKVSGTSTSTSTPSIRSGTGLNEPVPPADVFVMPSLEPSQATTAQPSSRRKMAIKKKLTPKKPPAVGTPATPSSPAANTRSKKLQLE